MKTFRYQDRRDLTKRTKMVSARKVKEIFVDRTVLDLGCNNGQLSFLAKELGAKSVVGIDKSDGIKGVREIKKIKRRAAKRVDFWQLNIEGTEFKLHCPEFDVILFCSLLAYLKNPVDFIKWVDSHTRQYLLFETNSGEQQKDQIDLIIKYTSFTYFDPLGMSGGKDQIHYLWLCSRSGVERRYLGWHDLPITFVPIDEITGWEQPEVPLDYPLDSNKYRALKENIRINGIVNPLILRRKKGVIKAFAGAHRYYAAKELGYKYIPCKFSPK